MRRARPDLRPIPGEVLPAWLRRGCWRVVVVDERGLHWWPIIVANDERDAMTRVGTIWPDRRPLEAVQIHFGGAHDS